MDPKNRPDALAVELLLIVAAREHLWPLVPPEAQGAASKALGAALVLVLLSMVYRLAPRSRWLCGVLALAAWYSLQTLLCAAWFTFDPWPVAPGVGMCSARVDFDLGAFGLLGVLYLAFRLSSCKN